MFNDILIHRMCYRPSGIHQSLEYSSFPPFSHQKCSTFQVVYRKSIAQNQTPKTGYTRKSTHSPVNCRGKNTYTEPKTPVSTRNNHMHKKSQANYAVKDTDNILATDFVEQMVKYGNKFVVRELRTVFVDLRKDNQPAITANLKPSMTKAE